MDVQLQNIQFLLRKDAVTYTVKLPPPLGTDVFTSTEASIRSHMTVPSENWGNDDARVDAQACLDAKYPDWGFTLVFETEPDPNAPAAPPFSPIAALSDVAIARHVEPVQP
jgi:hypothetical protein